MPRAGDVYSLPSNYEAVAGEVATATQHNSPLEDLQSDANTARPVAYGGTGATTAAGARTNLGIDVATAYVSKSSNYTLLGTDDNSVVRFSAAATCSFTAAATLGNGWHCWVYADGGDVTLDPNGSETINGSTTKTLVDGKWAFITCNGTNLIGVLNLDLDGLVLPQSSGAAPTEQGRVELDTDDDTVKVGDGSATKTLAYTDETHGKQSIWMPASAMVPAVTSGAATGVSEESTNKHTYATLDFDATSDEYACFESVMPDSWNEGTLTFKAAWTTEATDADGVAWAMQAVAIADGDASDVAYGTAVVVTDDAQSNAGDVLITAESSALTVAGSPVAGELVQFRVFRDVSDANDDMTEDAKLRGIYIYYTTNASTDA